MKRPGLLSSVKRLLGLRRSPRRGPRFERPRAPLGLEAIVVYREPFFYKRQELAPLCPTCWQQPERRAVYLPPERRVNEGTPHRICSECKSTFWLHRSGE